MICLDFGPKMASRAIVGAPGAATIPIPANVVRNATTLGRVRGTYFPTNPVARAPAGRVQGGVHAKARIAAL